MSISVALYKSDYRELDFRRCTMKTNFTLLASYLLNVYNNRMSLFFLDISKVRIIFECIHFPFCKFNNASRILTFDKYNTISRNSSSLRKIALI